MHQASLDTLGIEVWALRRHASGAKQIILIDQYTLTSPTGTLSATLSLVRKPLSNDMQDRIEHLIDAIAFSIGLRSGSKITLRSPTPRPNTIQLHLIEPHEPITLEFPHPTILLASPEKKLALWKRLYEKSTPFFGTSDEAPLNQKHEARHALSTHDIQ